MNQASMMNFEGMTLGRDDATWPKYQELLKQNVIPVPEESEEDLLAQHKVLAVSFYTPDYAEPAKRLAGTLDKFKIPHDLVGIAGSKGDRAWYTAEVQKASFLLKMLDKHPDYDTVVWLDSDGEMIRFPRLFWHIPAVLGFHYQAFKMPMDATVVVHQRSRKVLESWVKVSQVALEEKWKCPSQTALNVVLERDDVEWVQLPRAYAVLWRWNDGRPTDWAVFMHERWNRNSKVPTRGTK